jgi:Divergent InlB B-repeat domain
MRWNATLRLIPRPKSLRHVALALLLLVACTSGWAQVQPFANWDRGFGDAVRNTKSELRSSRAIGIDSSGNLAYLLNSIDVAADIDVRPNFSGNLLIKASGVTGNVIWQRRLPATASALDIGLQLAIDSSDNVITLSVSTESGALLVRKFAGTNGSLLWEYAVNAGTPGATLGGTLAIADNGQVALARIELLSLHGGRNRSAITLLSKEGGERWSRVIEDNGDFGGALPVVAFDKLGDVFYATARGKVTESIVDDWVVGKLLGSTGDVQWRQQGLPVGVLIRGSYPIGLAVDKNSDLIVTGINGQSRSGNQPQLSSVTTKYAGANGSTLWSRHLKPANLDESSIVVQDFTIDEEGNAFVVGENARQLYAAKLGATDGAVRWEHVLPSRESGRTSRASALGLRAVDKSVVIAGVVDPLVQGGRLIGTSDYITLTLGSDGAARTQRVSSAPIEYSENFVLVSGNSAFTKSILDDGRPDSSRLFTIAKQTFAPSSSAISITPLGTGAGQVEVTGLGMSSVVCEARCRFESAQTTTVTLRATPWLDSEFLGWIGGGCTGTTGTCTVNLDRAVSVTATFRKQVPLPGGLTNNIDLGNFGRHVIALAAPNGDLQVGRMSNGSFFFSPHTPQQPVPQSFTAIAGGNFAGTTRSVLAFSSAVTDATTQDFLSISYMLELTGQIQNVRQVKNAWRLQAVGDLDGDGRADFVWRFVGIGANPNDTGVSYIWFDGVPRKRGGAPLSWQLVGAIDINADGAADMVYVSPTNDVRVLMATPNRTCTNLSGGRIPAGFTALRFADFTGNRGGDLLLRNASTGVTALLSLDAIGIELPSYTGAPDDPNASCTTSALAVRQQLRQLPNSEPSWTYYDAGDVDGDGIHDVIWKRADNSIVVWLMGANGTVKQVLPNAGIAPAGFTPILH